MIYDKTTYNHVQIFTRPLRRHMRVHTGENLYNVCNLLRTSVFTVERNHTNVVCMTRYLVSLEL